MIPTVLSWQTFKKRYKPQMRNVQDGTLGITYSVEPTMRYNGFFCTSLDNKWTDSGVPLGFDERKGTPKKQVIEWLNNNHFYDRYKICVYHVWHVRREYGTVMIDIFLK